MKSSKEKQARTSPSEGDALEPSGGGLGTLMAEQLAEMQVSLRLRDEVFAMLVQDIKTPLYGVSLNVSILERLRPSNGDWRPRVQESVSEMQRGLALVNVLIGNLLEIDRIGDGGFTLDLREHGTLDLLEVAARVVAPLARARDVRITTRLRDGASRLRCDRARMVQVIAAMILNSVRRTPAGGQCHFVVRHNGLKMHLSAHDRGPRLDADEVGAMLAPVTDDPRLMAPLRLFMARRVLSLHGGSLDARTDDAAGMVFEALLPAPLTS